MNLKQRLKKYIDFHPEYSTRTIQIKIYNISWLNQERQLLKFYNYMANKADQKTYSNELIYALLHDQNYSWQLLKFFLLFLLKVTLVTCHHYYIITSFVEEFWYNWIRLVIFLLMLLALYQEVIQFKRKPNKYFIDPWNYV